MGYARSTIQKRFFLAEKRLGETAEIQAIETGPGRLEEVSRTRGIPVASFGTGAGGPLKFFLLSADRGDTNEGS